MRHLKVIYLQRECNDMLYILYILLYFQLNLAVKTVHRAKQLHPFHTPPRPSNYTIIYAKLTIHVGIILFYTRSFKENPYSQVATELGFSVSGPFYYYIVTSDA